MVANRSAFSAREVHDRLRTALKELQQAERNAVLWFSEMVQRKLYRELGYFSIHQYAELELGFGKSKTSQFIRLSESLRELPALRRSVAKGELSWTKAREVAKVATPQTEARWIQEAQRSPRRVLESRVAETRLRARRQCRTAPGQASLEMGSGGNQSKAEDEGRQEMEAAVPVDVHVRMTAEQYGRYQALLQALRKHQLDENQTELLLAGLGHLLHAATETRPAQENGGDQNGGSGRKKFTRVNSRSPYQVVVLVCPQCKGGRIATNRGEKTLTPQDLRAILCDASLRTPGKRNRTPVPERVRRAVLERDRYRCRAAGCGKTTFLAVHHLVPRDKGGTNSADNLLTLCSTCHRTLHAGVEAIGLFSSTEPRKRRFQASPHTARGAGP